MGEGHADAGPPAAHARMFVHYFAPARMAPEPIAGIAPKRDGMLKCCDKDAFAARHA